MSRGSLARESGVAGRSTHREDGRYSVDRAHPQAATSARRNRAQAQHGRDHLCGQTARCGRYDAPLRRSDDLRKLLNPLHTVHGSQEDLPKLTTLTIHGPQIVVSMASFG